jgi:hypothetical protein
VPFGLGRRDEAAADPRALDALLSALPADPVAIGPATGWAPSHTKRLLGRDLPLFTHFMAERVRSSVGGGLLRFLTPATEPSIDELNGSHGWNEDWPSIPSGVVFATDWLGALYLFSHSKPKNGQPRIARLDSATAQYELYDATFADFCLGRIGLGWQDLLAVELFQAWRRSGCPVPGPAQCVCPKIPLSFGAPFDASNLEVMPLVVWLYISGQIHEQVRKLPPGTKISGVSIDGEVPR